jgi:hypothetical protein
MLKYERGKIKIKDNAKKIKREKGRLKGGWGRYVQLSETKNKRESSFIICSYTEGHVTYQNKAGYEVTAFDLIVLQRIKTSS